MFGSGLQEFHSKVRFDASLSVRERAEVSRIVRTMERAANDGATELSWAPGPRTLLERYRLDLLDRLQRHLEGSL